MPRTAKHLEPTRWKPGASGNPAGRPQGSRSKLNELALKLLHADFAIHGEETIRRVREKKPEVYLASVVSLLPKQAEKLNSPFVDLSDDELEQLEQLLAALRAKTVDAIARGTEQHSFNEKPTNRINGRHVVKNAATVTHAALNDHGNSADQESQAPSALQTDLLELEAKAAVQQEPSSSDTGSSS